MKEISAKLQSYKAKSLKLSYFQLTFQLGLQLKFLCRLNYTFVGDKIADEWKHLNRGKSNIDSVVI